MMTIQEKYEKDRIRSFNLKIGGHCINAMLKDNETWDIRILLTNGVNITAITPKKWGFTRVMQFIGNLIESRPV